MFEGEDDPHAEVKETVSMRTSICDLLDIEFPIVAFSHCRDLDPAGARL